MTMTPDLPPAVLAIGFALFLATAVAAAPPSSTGTATKSEGSSTEDATVSGEGAEAGSPPVFSERLEIRARADDAVGVAWSATEGATGRVDLERRPILRSGEVVETVPGVIATQHSGGGKANQFFLRGFNLDHGTDLRISLEDVPVNLPTHGHGQGYADLSFVIPELVEAVSFRKGPYSADTGDFSSAGAVRIEYARDLADGVAELSAGSFGFRRALVADSFALAGGKLLGALEAATDDGPFTRPDDYEKVNGLLRYRRGDASRGYTLTFMGYDGSWRSSDQIPLRAVEQGLVGRFGLLDPDLGGDSSRASLSADWHRAQGQRWTRASAFVLHYDLELLSNFTYFLDDPEAGDQFRQHDDRIVAGARWEEERRLAHRDRSFDLGYGGELRHDAIDNGLDRTVGGETRAAVRDDDVDQLLAGAWGEVRLRPAPWLRIRAGLRADTLQADVRSSLPANSGERSDTLVSPKLSLAFGPFRKTELYLDLGSGFHSNDARGATVRIDPVTGEPALPVDLLVRSRGADVGVRTTAIPGLNLAVSAFLLELDSELVFIGDAGGTEASRTSRRTGVELASFYRPRPWLAFDLDAAWTDARFTELDPAGAEIPGAIEEAYAAGVSVEGRSRWKGSLRWRYFGPRPLTEDGAVRSRSTSLTNLRLTYTFANGLELTLDTFNVLDRRDNDIEYFYASRLPGEPLGGVEDIHFHPLVRRTVRLSSRFRF
jgi:hypothetical protein